MKSKKLNKKLVFKKATIANLRGKDLDLIKGGRTDACPGTREECTRPLYCGTLNQRECNSDPSWCINTCSPTCIQTCNC